MYLSWLLEDVLVYFDLVLDLWLLVVMGCELFLLGYYVLDDDEYELECVLVELLEMIGVFEKL